MKWMISILAAALMTTWMGVAAQSGTAMTTTGHGALAMHASLTEPRMVWWTRP